MRACMTVLLVLAFTSGCTSVARVVPQYQVGDVVIARNFTGYPQFNGTEVRVTGAYQWRFVKGYNALPCYAITTVDGQELAAQDFQLKRLVARVPSGSP